MALSTDNPAAQQAAKFFNQVVDARVMQNLDKTMFAGVKPLNNGISADESRAQALGDMTRDLSRSV